MVKCDAPDFMGDGCDGVYHKQDLIIRLWILSIDKSYQGLGYRTSLFISRINKQLKVDVRIIRNKGTHTRDRDRTRPPRLLNGLGFRDYFVFNFINLLFYKVVSVIQKNSGIN